MIEKNSNDWIIKRCCRNDRAAQFQLFDQYCKMVFNTAYRFVLNSHDANDVTQETFIKVFAAIKSFRGNVPIGGWIRKIAVNQSLRFLEKTKKFQLMESIEGANGIGNEKVVFEEKDELHRAIEKLPDGARVVFTLFAIEGYKHHEIAEKLKISESTSKSQYQRSRKLLKELLTDKVADYYG